jgi:hypothetical protein
VITRREFGKSTGDTGLSLIMESHHQHRHNCHCTNCAAIPAKSRVLLGAKLTSPKLQLRRMIALCACGVFNQNQTLNDRDTSVMAPALSLDQKLECK